MIKLMGSTTFARLAGVNGPTIRLLEATGIINPARSDRGWRLFTDADVAAVKAYKAEQRKQRRQKAV